MRGRGRDIAEIVGVAMQNGRGPKVFARVQLISSSVQNPLLATMISSVSERLKESK